MKHKIANGELVELHNGERLYITDLTNDCDGTPLYNLGIHGHDMVYRGFPEDCLTVIEFGDISK